MYLTTARVLTSCTPPQSPSSSPAFDLYSDGFGIWGQKVLNKKQKAAEGSEIPELPKHESDVRASAVQLESMVQWFASHENHGWKEWYFLVIIFG